MEPDESNSKRKRLEPASSCGSLYPGGYGEWRGSKKAKSVSGSRSPSPSGTSTPGQVDTNQPTLPTRGSRSIGKLLPWSQESSRTNATKPSHPIPQGSANSSTPIQVSTSSARSGLEEALRRLRIVTNTVCPPLCSVIDDLTTCLHLFEASHWPWSKNARKTEMHFQAAANNCQEYNDLTDELKSLVEQLIRHLHDASSEDIIDSISSISEAMRKEIESIGVRQSRGGVRRILDRSGDDEDLRRRYRRVKQLFQQILGEASMSTWNITSEHFINTQLETLHSARLARFDSSLSIDINRRTCTENTRTRILEEAMTWSEDPNGAKIYWMNGMAGTGKTTIATTLCTILEARKQLAASFFCTRTSPECREAKRIVPTIAYQLARRSTPFRSALSKALKEDPDISTGSISSQFELLVRRPLIKVKGKLLDNLVVIVDALDECNDPQIVEIFLNLLFGAIVDLPIKFYVTSRPEPVIRNRMMLESERTRSILYLHEIEKSLVQSDIELYLREELRFMSPAEIDLKRLAEHASNLFIYAATAVRYIRPTGKTFNSQARLLTILALNTESMKKLSGLDALYSTILTAAIDDQDLEPGEQENIRLVLWTAICACEPILVETLSALCGLNKNSTTNALEPLRSVLYVSDYSELVTTLHASFSDYMLARERSGVFSCDKATHNQALAQRCFKILEVQLRFNIGSIESSFIPDSEICGLDDQIIANISEDLFYACRYWADHLSQTPITDNLTSLVDIFLSKHILFWMEVLNLKKCIASGVAITTKLSKWLLRNNSNTTRSLLELASSASRFIINYILSPSSAYTPHIYLSSLTLINPSNPLRSIYLPRFTGLIKISGTITNRLGGSTIISSWESEIEPQCAAFSPSRDLIVLGSDTGKISVQGVYNGNYLVEPYKAHKTSVQCLDISSNGLWTVSGSDDGILYIWSVQDGSLVSGPFRGHIGRVRTIKFSPDGAHIASGADDRVVGIWNTANATVPMRALTGHAYWINSVNFSPDGTRIASCSFDSIRIWDLFSETTVFIIQSHNDVVRHIQFTPDGAQIIAASPRRLNTWDTSSRSLVHSLVIPARLDSIIDISPEGERIASMSFSDHTICVWNRHTGKAIAGPFLCCGNSTKLVAFSDDGMRIVSIFDDKTVRVWNAYGRSEPVKPPSQNAVEIKYPYYITSPDRARVAQTLESGINIWDLETAAPIASINPESPVKSAQFSFNSSDIFVIQDPGRICTWRLAGNKAELINGPRRCSSAQDSLSLRSAACSANGTRVATCSKGKIELWDADLKSDRHKKSMTLFHLRVNNTSDPRSIAYLEQIYDWGPPPEISFSQNSERLITQVACSPQTTLHVWSADNGTLLAGPFLVKKVHGISPDGTLVLCSTSPESPSSTTQSLSLINADNGETTYLTDLIDTPSWEPKLSPDGSHVIFGSSSRCDIWDIQKKFAIAIEPLGVDRLDKFLYTPSGLCQTYGVSLGTREETYQVRGLRVDQPLRTTIGADGWLRDSESQPLLWLPQEIREEFYTDSEIFTEIKGSESFRVDYGNMLVGNEWSKCYISN